MALSDGRLVADYIDGDLKAFTTIVERHRTRLLWVARRYGHNEDDAQDILQEALFRASYSLHTWRHDSSLSTWLHRLVMNSGWDFRNRRPQVESSTLDDDTLPHDINPLLASDPIGRTEDIWHLHDSLARLHPNQRKALWLIDIEGYSIVHVAKQEGVKPGTIKSRRNRAREALRAEYSTLIGR
ncbi:MAG: sigma-70 family RNA polymerase sigma factor [Corynebacterium sp.]|uniref:sigma-70 family RNA polymerase sigma factor n=1 Tax=Corynebacterium sp. TaxID=1720 RepID=UPI0026DF53F5|nr:sigma-70 family RNA polymerase sigma factor [Corynebacterium sp.]MDO5670346.1 sigma-70 family RNA polymerase sigma factor [Corynebacterium sp.]